jgi:anthranilate phosphoribosyltransferase
MNPAKLFEQLFARQNLSKTQMQEAIECCMNGTFNDTHIATFLALMRMKGETTDELTAAAELMQKLAKSIDLGNPVVDIVGTGGDGKSTFNVSTASSFVVASLGINVAKHGNISVSSTSGSADLLRQAGFNINLPEDALKECMQQYHLAFLFAPNFHPAMQEVKHARQLLGVRTFFNLLGPLINPARATRQVVGVFDSSFQQSLAEVLVHLGSTRSLVVSSKDGLDEISAVAPTTVIEYKNQHYTTWEINPRDYGIHHHSIESVVVDSKAQSLILVEEALSGQPGQAYDMVSLNSASAIYCAMDDLSFSQAIEQAQYAIQSGKALKLFKELSQFTSRFGDKEAS